MILHNLKDDSDTASFSVAVQKGLGNKRGLYFPKQIKAFDNIQQILDLPLVARSVEVIAQLTEGEIDKNQLGEMIGQAFTFPAPLKQISEDIHCLELFHGPTLAFKDFGARFMAQCLTHFSNQQPITILTATSGDTGAAVAHAFYGIDNINVVILYPKGKISALQEKLFTTLGDNIHTVAIEADFDACQSLVKAAFDDQQVRQGLHLNSANSINISRLFAQVCYYFEAVAQLPSSQRENLVVSVPSGNFGNLTAGIIAKVLGLPVEHFVAATNANDTVPRYLQTGEWQPNDTIATLSNAMDVSQPNNWPRIEAMMNLGMFDADSLSGISVDEEYTQLATKQLAQQGYVSEPHAAVAYKALRGQMKPGQTGIFLGTAHPAKFRDSVENILGQPISLPKALADSVGKASFSKDLPNDYNLLKQHLFQTLNG